MGFFSSNLPKRVTQLEFKEIINNLSRKLDSNEIIEVEKLFRADLQEGGVESGISQAEYEAAMSWLEQNKNKHVLEDDDVESIKKYFEEHLKD